MKKIETFVSDDGRTFTTLEECQKHEQSCSAFKSMITGKIGEFSRNDLRLGGKHGEAVIDSLPFTAPWMGAFGSCLIKVTDIRRNQVGKIEFQLGDENNVPYDDGNAWRPSESFYSEWPQ